MISIRAEETRYVVVAPPAEAALLRKIPGVRQLAANGTLQAPRQPGTILALDDLFGDDGWAASSDLSTEVSEARQREHPAAQGEATAELEGKEISVTCQYGDKELVKLVPGYRWSAAQRRWYLPAQPMALRILEQYFGEKLTVSDVLRDYVALKAIDEDAAVERASRQVPATIPATHEPAEVSQVLEQALDAVEAASAPPATGEGALLERLDRLAGAVEELVGLLRDGTVRPALPAQPVEQVNVDERDSPEGEPQADWRELLVAVHRDATAAMPLVSGLLQTAAPDHVSPLRAVAGIGQSLLGDDETALRSLRRAMDDAATLDGELAGAAREAYGRSALRMFGTTMGPRRVPGRVEDVLELLRVEIHQTGAGFSEEALTSKAAASLLEYLVNDPTLRSASPLLSDCCRVAHLLAVSRSGSWMVVDRVTDLLRDREIGADCFGLAVTIMANALFDAGSMDEWRYRWPSDDSGTADLRWLTEACLSQLPGAHAETAQLAALACLACIAGGPIEWATMDERRKLVKFIPLASHQRAYAEFLAAYQPAASGTKRVAEQFPGYMSILQEQPIARSYVHMLDVFVMQESNHGLAHRIAEDVIAPALRKRGLPDPAVLIELLDLVAEAPKGDSKLNELSGLIEDGEFVGAEAFSHEQRLVVYSRALEEARKRGHDVDGVIAFDRVVREHLAHGEAPDVRSLCEKLTGTFRAVRVQAAVYEVLLEMQLEAGEPYAKTAEELQRLAKRPQSEELNHELAGLVHAYPELANVFERDEQSAAPPRGGRVVLIGGHEWLKKHAGRVLSAEWGLDVAWLGPEAAKNGAQALGLATGSADLLVINAACISHAASGRVLNVVKETGMRYVMHHSRGVGALLSLVALSLQESAAGSR